MASTNARSAPVRIQVESARSPSAAPRASITIDLPAPVSPVRTLKRAPQTMLSDSIMAKSRIVSSTSRARSDTSAELCQDTSVEVDARAPPGERRCRVGDAHRYCLAVLQRAVDLPIDGYHGGLRGPNLESQREVGGDD